MLEKLALQDYLANDALDFLAMTQVKLVNKVHDMNIHERIKAAREKKALSMEQLGDIVGVAWQTVQQWENGKTAPKRKRLDKVAAALDTTVEQLLLGDNTNQIQVPMIDAKLSAGSGSLIFSSEASTSLTFKSSYFKRRGLKEDHAYVFPVSGDSMVDAHIIDGSVVLINGLAKHPMSNDIFAIWIDDEIFVKELVKKSDGSWVARSHNKAKNYPDIPIKTTNNGIIGLVVWCGFDM